MYIQSPLGDRCSMNCKQAIILQSKMRGEIEK